MSLIDTFISRGCTAWYPLFNTPKNRINNSTGTVNGTVTPYKMSSGHYAGYFGGSAYITGLNTLLPGQTFSLVCNFMQTETPTADVMIYGYKSSDGTNYVQIGVNSSNNIFFKCSNGTTTITCTYSTTITNNKWYQVACIHTTTAMTLYVNGVSVNTGGAVSLTLANLTIESIGSYGSNTNIFKGYLKDFLAFNTAIAAANVKKMYTQLYVE